MSGKTKIEWTETSWNPITGCTKISEGCQNCYAAAFAKRLQAMGNPRYPNGFQVTVHEDLIERPLKWKKPQFIFVNSMSDLFHEDIPEDEFLTESLAKIYIKQRRYAKALEIIRKLSLKYPEKSVYFASLIDKIANK